MCARKTPPNRVNEDIMWENQVRPWVFSRCVRFNPRHRGCQTFDSQWQRRDRRLWSRLEEFICVFKSEGKPSGNSIWTNLFVFFCFHHNKQILKIIHARCASRSSSSRHIVHHSIPLRDAIKLFATRARSYRATFFRLFQFCSINSLRVTNAHHLTCSQR